MTNQFIHEEISMLFCSEKFHGGGGGGGWHCNYSYKLQVHVSKRFETFGVPGDDLDPSLTIFTEHRIELIK